MDPIRLFSILTFMSILINTCNAQGTSQSLTTAQKQLILNQHNAVRNNVAAGNFTGFSGNLPSATNMNELLWVCKSYNCSMILIYVSELLR